MKALESIFACGLCFPLATYFPRLSFLFSFTTSSQAGKEASPIFLSGVPLPSLFFLPFLSHASPQKFPRKTCGREIVAITTGHQASPPSLRALINGGMGKGGGRRCVKWHPPPLLSIFLFSIVVCDGIALTQSRNNNGGRTQ